jgi:hypothetical protein
MMRTLCVAAAALVLATAILAPGQHVEAKGNDVWVLAGGDLGDYAMSVTLDLVDGPPGSMVPAPATVPPMHYDLFNSYGNFAVEYQLAHGPWVRYYPGAGLLRYQGATATAPEIWYAASPATTAELQRAIAAALAAKVAGQLERNPVAVDFRARSLANVNYRLSPYGGSGVSTQSFYATDSGEFQMHGNVSEEFVMHALVDTISRPPAGSALELPVYEITYAGEIRPGLGIGGLLGYYTPPVDGRPGRFWDDGYADDKGTLYYTTTPEFDVVVARALGTADAGRPTVTSNEQVAVSRHSRSTAVAVALATGLGLMTLLGVTVAARRRATSV